MASKKITTVPATCPDCGSRVYDNSQTKRNPKAPDAKCSNGETCGWVGWLPSAPKTASGANRLPQQYPWARLLKLSVQYVQKEITPLFQGKCTPEMEKELATSLFIAASQQRGDIFAKATAEPSAEPAPPSPPPARPAPQPRRADYDDDGLDGLPF